MLTTSAWIGALGSCFLAVRAVWTNSRKGCPVGHALQHPAPAGGGQDLTSCWLRQDRGRPGEGHSCGRLRHQGNKLGEPASPQGRPCRKLFLPCPGGKLDTTWRPRAKFSSFGTLCGLVQRSFDPPCSGREGTPERHLRLGVGRTKSIHSAADMKPTDRLLDSRSTTTYAKKPCCGWAKPRSTGRHSAPPCMEMTSHFVSSDCCSPISKRIPP